MTKTKKMKVKSEKLGQINKETDQGDKNEQKNKTKTPQRATRQTAAVNNPSDPKLT